MTKAGLTNVLRCGLYDDFQALQGFIYIKILLAADEVEVPMFFSTDNGETQDTRHHDSLDVIKHLTEDSPF